MEVKKCRWKDAKQAPVMFMIDDFANKFMTDKEDGKYLGSDWGGRLEEPNSMQWFVCEHFLKKYLDLKVTYFLVVGKRADIIRNGKSNYTAAIDDNEGFMQFLQKLASDSRFEIAFHGMEHGIIMDDKFVQEWERYSSVEDALKNISDAKKIYRSVTGKEFSGGKYCGYKSNRYSDASISDSNFEWWCRRWNAGDLRTTKPSDADLDLHLFGNNVVDIPSTVDGSFWSLKCVNALFTSNYRKYIRSLIWLIKNGLTVEKLLEYLVNNGKVISIQEHSSPIREDERRQTPNIIDDIDNLYFILDFLSKYDVWYATGSEIANYYRAFMSVKLNYTEDTIYLDCPQECKGNIISLLIKKSSVCNLFLRDTILSKKYFPQKVRDGLCFNINVYPKQILTICSSD